MMNVKSCFFLTLSLLIDNFFLLSVLTKPDSVTNATVDSIVYDSASPGDKIKLTVSWNPPKGRQNKKTNKKENN